MRLIKVILLVFISFLCFISCKKSCPECNGRGTFLIEEKCNICNGNSHIEKECSKCLGNGFIETKNKCPECGGSGENICNYSFEGEKGGFLLGAYHYMHKCEGGKLNRCDYDKPWIVYERNLQTCSNCNGRGYVNCSKCGGSGEEMIKNNCSLCEGKGKKLEPCSSCNATGKVKRLDECKKCLGVGKVSLFLWK